MAQQTAMQALVEQMKINDIYKPCMPYLMEIIDEVYLPMEKEQIVNAWNKRVFRGTFVKGWHIETQSGEEYYSKTYTQGNK